MSRNILNEITVCKYNNTQPGIYALCMKRPHRPHTRETIARNLRYLLDQAGWSERVLEAKSGVKQKTINNILNQRSAPTIETTEALAAAFGLTGWQLLLPSLPKDLIGSPTLRKLFEDYVDSSPEGRDLITQIARREAGRQQG